MLDSESRGADGAADDVVGSKRLWSSPPRSSWNLAGGQVLGGDQDRVLDGDPHA